LPEHHCLLALVLLGACAQLPAYERPPLTLPNVWPTPWQSAVCVHKAADLGFAPVQAALGMLYARMKDFQKAVLWWRLAADRGDPEARYKARQPQATLAKAKRRAEEWLQGR
jgi:TPR repeat protein